MTNKLEEIILNADQKKRWIETRSALLWGAPAFTHLLYSMLNPSGGELSATFTRDVPIAATDGSALILNPDTFFKLPLPQRVFVTAHEILHCVFDHPGFMARYARAGKVKYPDGTELDYDQDLMNMAMDYVINDILIASNVGQFVPNGCHDRTIATADDSFLDAYKKVYKKRPQGQQPFDKLLPPGTSQGKDQGKAQQDRSQTEWDTAVAGAMATAKAQGKLPAALERLFKDALEPEITWQDHIRSFFARRVGGGSYDWRKPDRRFIVRDIFTPSPAGDGCGDVVVAVDTSGSIGQRELDRFFNEMRSILEDVNPQRLYVVWCDAKVHRVDELDSPVDVSSLKPIGGGGTDFRPVFDWINQQGLDPDALVYLTDGYGAFPDRSPSYPVLWGAIAKGVNYPFGEVLPLDIK